MEKLRAKAVVPAGFVFRRYADSKVLARTGYGSGVSGWAWTR